MTLRIGMVGLGVMGLPMAHNVLRAGFPLTVWARRAGVVDPLVAAGACEASSIAALARQVDVLLTVVADTPDVAAVLFGPDGAANHLGRGAVVIDMSTIAPEAARQMAQRLAAQGVDWLDAPVSGGQQGAISATLSIMVGGERAVFERMLPLLQALGRNIVHLGAAGAGQVAKACNQIVAAVSIAGVAEALAFAERQGVDAAKVREALLGGFAYSKVLEVHGLRMLEQQFQPGFKASLHDKDMRIVLAAAREVEAEVPLSTVAAERIHALVAQGDGDLDSSALVMGYRAGASGRSR